MDKIRFTLILLSVAAGFGYGYFGLPRWPMIVSVILIAISAMPYLFRERRFLDLSLMLALSAGMLTFMAPGDEPIKAILVVGVIALLAFRMLRRLRRLRENLYKELTKKL